MQPDIKDKKPTTDEIDVHRTIVLWLFLATLVFTILLAAPLIYADKSGEVVLTTLPVVILAGILGSFVSALNRIYSSANIFPLGKYSVHLKNSNGYLIAYSSIPPLVGAISAAVLYVIFSGQIITGPFFPNFTCELETGCNEFQLFLGSWSPDQAEDYAKAIVWGFIAGFSERFVPDILNRVTKESQ
ncbi:hypothetical protein A9Q89_03455 [Gammaproteobacteria bacterium 53_120_T64]|nr:hypothetical protein A9Q89_03455 [Gammaproteobacteria bacterium 53_120_T64]